MRLLTELCSLPTAPFIEDRVIAYVERFARQRRRLALSRDRSGNLMLELPGSTRTRPRLVFVAHMDHPGLVADTLQPPRRLSAYFRGGVYGEYLRGVKVRFFGAKGEVTGRIESVDETDERGIARRVSVRVNAAVAPNTPGMFDVGAARVRAGKFHSRACDDLAGAAAALTLLDRLHRSPGPSPVAVLLTRAEEEGFIGAVAAATRPQLLRRSDLVVSIECSAEQAYARQGDGVILRVGDRTSIFNSQLTYFLTQQAEALAKEDKGFRFQRSLMPGGTCEATVFDVYGFTAAAVCVPLGNYHNMDRRKKTIAAEYIDLGDWNNMVKLFERLARNAAGFRPGHAPLKKRIEQRFAKVQHLL